MCRVDYLVSGTDLPQGLVKRALHLRVQKHLRFLDYQHCTSFPVLFERAQDCQHYSVLKTLAQFCGTDRQISFAHLQIEGFVEVHAFERLEEKVEFVRVTVGIEAQLAERVSLDRGLQVNKCWRLQHTQYVLHECRKMLYAWNLRFGTVGALNHYFLAPTSQLSVNILQQGAQQRVPGVGQVFS